jgi:glutamyl/glutaminyl-tRNA synthetase
MLQKRQKVLARAPSTRDPERTPLGMTGTGTEVLSKRLAEKSMPEYDLDGWTAKDLVNIDNLSMLGNPNKRPRARAADGTRRMAWRENQMKIDSTVALLSRRRPQQEQC